MKKKLAVAAVALVVFLPFVAWAQIWLHAVVANPTAGQVLVDTGPIAGPTSIEFCAYAGADVATVLRVQLRNAANSATVHEQFLPVPITGFATMCPTKPIQVQDQERVRIINNGVVVGNVSVSLIY